MRPLVPVVLVCATLLAGCGSIETPATPEAGKATSQDASLGNAAAAPKDPFQTRAAVVAKAWEDSGILKAWTTGFVPLEELRIDPVVSGKGPNEDFGISYTNGCIRTRSPLADKAGHGIVRFADGTSLPVPLVGAQTAYSRLPKRSANCPMADKPSWLTITAARLSTVEIRTTRGQGIVPAWHYTVAGLTQPFISVAVAPSAISALPHLKLGEHQPGRDGLVSAGGLAAKKANGSSAPKGDVLVFRIRFGACDKDPRGLVQETSELVIIGGSVTPNTSGLPCVAMQQRRQVEVRMKEPVGSRVIVDAVSAIPMLTPPASRP